MKRTWLVLPALLTVLLLARPAGACACGGEAYNPWPDRLVSLSGPALVAVVGGWITLRAIRKG